MHRTPTRTTKFFVHRVAYVNQYTKTVWAPPKQTEGQYSSNSVLICRGGQGYKLQQLGGGVDAGWPQHRGSQAENAGVAGKQPEGAAASQLQAEGLAFCSPALLGGALSPLLP